MKTDRGRCAAAAVLAAILLAAGCGPSRVEVGQAVLLAGPVVFLLSTGVLVVALRAWPTALAPLRSQLPALGAMLGLGIAGAALALGRPAGRDLFGAAIWLYGCSYATLLLVCARVLLARGAARIVAQAHALPFALALVCALGFALGGDTSSANGQLAVDIFTWPGMGGWLAGPVFIAFVMEGVLRRRAAARARRPTP